MAIALSSLLATVIERPAACKEAVSTSNSLANETLEFPSAYSMGNLFTCKWNGDDNDLVADKERVRVAQGQVKVPVGELLQLNLSYAAAEHPQDIERLARYPSVIAINARNLENFDDTTMLHICRVPQLELVLLDSTETSDRGVEELSKLKKLKRVSLAKTMITGKSFATLGQISTLQGLTLMRNRLDDTAFKQLACLKNLRRLELDATGIGNEALRNMAGLNQLRTLALQDNLKLTDEGLVYLAKLPRLTHVDLSGTSVTPQCGRFLKLSKGLTKVRLDQKFTDDDLKALKQDMPHTWLVKGKAPKVPVEMFAPLK